MVDPHLASLGDNGGPTETIALLPGSPAIDAGSNSVLDAPLSLTTDHRGPGFPRIVGPKVDIGAFEYDSLTAGLLTPPKASEGQAIANATVFHFTDADSADTVSDYAATVNTGNAVLTSVANPGNVRIVAHAGGGFDVTLAYVYPEGFVDRTFGVTVTDHNGIASRSIGGFSVQDYSLRNTTPTATYRFHSGQTFVVPVATFIDADPAGAAADFKTLINWGDSHTSVGSITGGSGGTFTISGSHAYVVTVARAFNITVTITDVGGPTLRSNRISVFVAP